MNRTCRIMGTLAFLLYPVVCLSADRIELTNESAFVTNQYWEEGDQVKFHYRGGVVGIHRSLVQNIQDSVLADTVAEEDTSQRDEAPREREETVPEPKRELPTSPPRDDFLREKESIRVEITAASEAYRKARSGKDPKLIVETRKGVLSLQTKMNALQVRVRKAHGGIIPGWWDDAE